MDKTKTGRRLLHDFNEITTYKREICLANILEVEAGTTGCRGGDSGHGGRTYFRITDLGGTDIHVDRIGAFGSDNGNGGFEVTLGGDSELVTIIEALKFIVKVLEKEKNESEN